MLALLQYVFLVFVLFSFLLMMISITIVSGVWFFHCHIEFHADIGMGLLIQVGNEQDFPRAPKNFPRCGNWRYHGDSLDDDKSTYCVSGATYRRPHFMTVLIATAVTFLRQFVYMNGI